jgi:hypothetical protein
MGARFVNVDRNTPLLFPADLRGWIAEDHLVHFVVEAIEQLDISGFKVNETGSGSEQYPPEMMATLPDGDDSMTQKCKNRAKECRKPAGFAMKRNRLLGRQAFRRFVVNRFAVCLGKTPRPMRQGWSEGRGTFPRSIVAVLCWELRG